MDRQILRSELYGLVDQVAQDGLGMAIRAFAPCGQERSADAEVKWGRIEAAVTQFNEGFEALEDESVPLNEALDKLTQSATSLTTIADQLDGDRPRHLVVGDRLRAASTRLMDAAVEKKGQLL